jgi:S1-C subfamily serine protease
MLIFSAPKMCRPRRRRRDVHAPHFAPHLLSTELMSFRLAGKLCLLASTIVAGHALGAQQQDARATELFNRFAAFATRIQIVEKLSGAKSAIGSGFFTTAGGHIVTNYHVVSSVINWPDRYRTELVEPNGSTTAATVLAIDVVHDLAVLKSDVHNRPFFTLQQVTPRHGERLFSLGNPKDLGMSIVEGTYNGLLEHTLYPRIHLTAPINPGMSGGPTIDEQGRVIGINVATEGNEVSFLVPVERAIALLQTALSGDPPAEAPTLGLVAKQLRQHQDAYMKEMLGASAKMIDFGPFRVVTQPAAFFRCWGDGSRSQELPYERTRHRCTTEDDIYLDVDQTTGSLSLNHQLITTKTLNAAQFFALYTKTFAFDNSPSGEEEYVTNWKCVTRNVRNDTVRMRAAMCVRRYRKLGELYDANLKLAVLGRSDVGLVSTLNVTGLTYDNLTKLSERFIKQVSWR